MHNWKHRPLKALLFDLDGVLYIGDKALHGAVESVSHIRDLGLSVAGVTNTTTQARSAIAEKLARLNIPIPEKDIYTPAALAVHVIGSKRARLFVRQSLLEDFQGISMCQEHPEFVVMGDIGGEGYPPETLLQIFSHVMQGATILALHKNRFWQKPDGLHLDLGTFVAAIEYATGQKATVLGKPSGEFYLGVCKALRVDPEQALMVGDDIESDIGGAQECGLRTALVQTGKYRAEFVKASGIKADLVLPSIADLSDALKLL